MTNLRDAILRPLAAARAKRIGSDIDVRAVVVLIAQPSEITGRGGRLQRHDALRRRRRTLLAEQESNRLSLGGSIGLGIRMRSACSLRGVSQSLEARRTGLPS